MRGANNRIERDIDCGRTLVCLRRPALSLVLFFLFSHLILPPPNHCLNVGFFQVWFSDNLFSHSAHLLELCLIYYFQSILITVCLFSCLADFSSELPSTLTSADQKLSTLSSLLPSQAFCSVFSFLDKWHYPIPGCLSNRL